MKKLFTLIAFLAVFLGAKAEWVTDYEIDYSKNTSFPFYVMGYVPEWVDGVMTDYGANFRYETQANLDGDGDGKWKDGEESVGTAMAGNTEYQKVTGAGPYWHQYFMADGVPTELDGSYKVTAMVKASEEINLELHMGWGQWWTGTVVNATAKVGTEWTEVEWEFSGIGGTSCNIDAKPGASTATIEWKWLKVEHNATGQHTVTWQELLTSDGTPVVIQTTSAAIPTYMGNAETPWGDRANIKFNDTEENNGRPNTTNVCAWGKEKGVNMNDNDGWDPFPATIEVDPTDANNHVFVVHGKAATTEGDASAWDNQFWIMSTKELKVGTQYKFQFRYRASQAAKTNTQMHSAQPSDYLHYAVLGDINFTTDWQVYDAIVAIPEPQNKRPIYSIAFNLNPENKEAIDFYFDDLSIQEMKLDEGYFIAGANPDAGLQYDLDNATQFEYDAEEELYVATIGTKGQKDTWVSEIMISTVRGNDAAFKSNTLKPASIENNPDAWPNYTESSLAKLKLPAVGVWTVSIDTENKQMNFVLVEGEAKDPIDVVTNNTENVINGLERDWRGNDNDGNPIEAGGVGEGQPWDNQFWIVANRKLAKGEVTHLKFKYKASKEAKVSTQCHGEPGGYKHWGAIGDVNFTTEWQDFDADFTIPNEADGMKSIAFNMAEIKEANIYEIKDVQWYLKDDGLAENKTWENLIDQTGGANFVKKEGATGAIEPTGINGIINDATIGSNVIYNLSGQRVTKNYKGVVIINGRKVVNK